MSATWLPCGTYHENYRQDHAWFQTKLIKGKMILLLAILIAMPFIVDPDQGILPKWIILWFNIDVFIKVGYFVLGAIGVQLLIGYCGQITLGHIAFVGVGAFTSALFMKIPVPWLHQAGLIFPISIIAAGLMGGLFSVLFGLPSARVKGFYLIMTTVAAQWVIVNFVLGKGVPMIFGSDGLIPLQEVEDKIDPLWNWTRTVIPHTFWGFLNLDLSSVSMLWEDGSLVASKTVPFQPRIGPFVLKGGISTYYMTLALVVMVFVALANLLRSKVGRAWVAIRDNDIAAEALGINIVYYKLLAFFVAGFIGGVAGASLTGWGYAVSIEHFDWAKSLWLVGYILVGGVGSIHGVIFGVCFITFLIEILTVYSQPIGEVLKYVLFFVEPGNIISGIKLIALGLAICLFLMFEPNGMSYRWWQVKNYFNLWPFSY